MTSDRTDLTPLLQGSAGTPEAVEQALPHVYDELKRLAAHFLRSERQDHTLMTTELVHEAYLRLLGLERMAFNDHRHFFATAALSMRRILVEHERRRRAQKRIPAESQVPLELAIEPSAAPSMDILLLDDALHKLAELNARQAQIVELRYFGGLTESQVAEVLEVSRPTVARDMRAAKRWLRREIRA